MQCSTNPVQVASTTVMLMIASCSFLVFNIPASIYFLCYGYGAFSKATASDLQLLVNVYATVTILSYVNNSINFFVLFFTVAWSHGHCGIED